MKIQMVAKWLIWGAIAALSCCSDSDNNNDDIANGKKNTNSENDGGSDVQDETDGSKVTFDSASASLCCNGSIDLEEECDDGCNNDDLDGCTDICMFTCLSDSDCDDGEDCNGEEICDVDAHSCRKGADLSNGKECGVGMACIEGVCRDISCERSEECYDECNTDAICEESTHMCTTGNPVENDTLCDNGRGYCSGGVCVEAKCGDNVQEPSEECDLGSQNGETNSGCTDSCTRFECGNKSIEGEEQCDDGNGDNLDGCDTNCRVELVYRINELNIIAEPAPDFCTFAQNETQGNAAASLFGGLLGERLGLLNILNEILNQSFENGDDNILFHVMGLEDPSFQTADPLVTIGVTNGRPADDWASRREDLDFPMFVESAKVDKDSLPTDKLPAEFLLEDDNATLQTTSPASLDLTAGFFILNLRQATIVMPVDPQRDAPSEPPAVSDSVVPPPSFGLTSDAEPQGVMCGAMLTSSFDTIPFIPEFEILCPEYTVCEGDQDPTKDECSSFADLMIGGCGGFLNPVEPDVDLDDDGDNDAFSLVAVFSQIRTKVTGIR